MGADQHRGNVLAGRVRPVQRRRLIALAALLAVAGALAVGCGDDEEPATSTTSASTPQSTMPESEAEQEALVTRFCRYLSKNEAEAEACAERVDALAVLNLAAAQEPLEQALYAVGESNECGPDSGPLCVEETLQETIAAVEDEG
jgi:hypothetical protein